MLLASVVRYVMAQPVPIPTYRFKVWNNLSTTISGHATTLNYSRSSWNKPGSNSIERLSYESIQATPTRIAAVRGIGFDEDTWDCWVNHYDDYSWAELVSDGLHVHYQALGWTQSLWDGNGSAATDNLDWNQLSSPQQAAARQVCYNRELWDEIELPRWPTLPSGPGPSPSTQCNLLCRLLSK